MMFEKEDIQQDPELGFALRLVEPDPPFAEVDWDALRSSIVARAELPLARRRTRSAQISRWMRPLIPLAAAASIAMAVWMADSPSNVGAPIADNSADLVAPSVSAEDLFQPELSDEEFRTLVNGESDMLLRFAVSGGEGEI